MSRELRECQAQDPRACYYHGAVIAMNEAIVRISNSNGKPNAEDLDTLYTARQRVEKAEEELRKQEWIAEAMGVRKSSPPAEIDPRTGEPVTYNAPVAVAPALEKRPPRKPLIPAPVPYDDNEFPPQVGPYDNAAGDPTVFTRHDKSDTVPSSIMVAGSDSFTESERNELMSLLRYQYTTASRSKNKVKQIHNDNMDTHQTERSLVLDADFLNPDNPEAVKNFHNDFFNLLKNGSPERKDRTQKFPPFSGNHKIVLYYG